MIIYRGKELNIPPEILNKYKYHKGRELETSDIDLYLYNEFHQISTDPEVLANQLTVEQVEENVKDYLIFELELNR